MAGILKDSKDIEQEVSSLKAANEELRVELALLRAESRSYKAKSDNFLESISRLEELIKFSPSVFYVKDKRGILLFVNNKFEKLFHLTREEIIGKTDHQIFPKKIADKFHENDRKVLTTKKPLKIEEEVFVGGELRTYISEKFPIYDKHMGEYLLYGISTDITDLKKIEEDRNKNEIILQQIMDNVADPIFVKDSKHRWTSGNKAFFKIFNKPRKEVLGKTDHDFFSDEQAEVFWMGDDEAFAKPGKPFSIVEKITDHTGKTAIISTRKNAFEDNEGGKLLVGVIRDITEQTRAEEELEKHRKNLENLVEERTAELEQTNRKLRGQQRTMATLMSNLPGMVYKCSSDEKLTMEFVSEGCYALTGHKPKVLLDSNYSVAWAKHIMLPQDREEAWSLVQKSLESKKPFELVYRIKTADAKIKWVWEKGTGIYDDKGSLEAVEGFVTDITERKLAEEKQAKIMKELARSNTELERFAYIASHDLQEPIRTIFSYAQLLRENCYDDLDSDGQLYLEYIEEGAANMRTLVTSLLGYSKLGYKSESFSRVKIKDILRYVTANLKQGIEDNKVRITYGKLPSVMGDSTQLAQLFQNIISNAIKYKGKKPPRIHIGAKKEDNEWLFWVQDNGIGIEKKYFNEIFKIFNRIHNKSKYPGTGIGLATCRRVVENHGGRIWVDSEKGKSTTFYFTIPEVNGAVD